MITVSDTIPLNDYCDLFGIKRMEVIVDLYSDGVWESATYAVGDLSSDDPEWEDKVYAETDRQWESINSAYSSALNKTGEYLSDLGLKISFNKENDTVSFHSDNWEEAGNIVLESINGYGLFHFESLEDLVSSGPFEGAREAVIAHIHWHKYRGEIFGETGIQRLFDKEFERETRYL